MGRPSLSLHVSALACVVAAMLSQGPALAAPSAEPVPRARSFHEACYEPALKRERVAAEACLRQGFEEALAARARGRTAAAITGLRELVLFDDLVPTGSPIPRRAVYEMAASYESIAILDSAADGYARYAAREPGASDAPDALASAVRLRILLGDMDQARRDLRHFVTEYRASRPNDAAALALQAVAALESEGDVPSARAALDGMAALIERGSLDQRIEAHARRAALLAHDTKSPAAASSARAAELAAVRTLFLDPPAAVTAIEQAYPSEGREALDARLRRTLGFVGAAVVAEADARRRRDVDPLVLPTYVGRRDAASVSAFVAAKWLPAYTKKRAAIRATEIAYIELGSMKPSPPPAALVDASAAVGAMWQALAADVRRIVAASPKPVDTALEDALVDALTRHARPVTFTCVSNAARFQVHSPAGASCERWLSRHYPGEFHGVDAELLPLVVPAAPAPAPPLTAGAP